MSLHRLTEITLGVPNVHETVEYYTEFGLTPLDGPADTREHLFATRDGGQQLRIVQSPVRRLLTLGIGADDHDDLGRIATSLTGLDIDSKVEGGQLATVEPITGVNIVVSIAPHLEQQHTPVAAYNLPGNIERPNLRAESILRDQPVRPRKLGHVVIGTTDKDASQKFFTQGLGFTVSDEIREKATFMRCSPDHHNVLVQARPLSFMHHTAWEVEDVDEIGRGARAMLENNPERHVWGLGRHWVGSNYFYYLRDPAGNFSEYYADLDEILDDQVWEPGVFSDQEALAWGPPPSPSFINPDDLAELMSGSHRR
jgi:catechol 2,3-dioxygenase-like lactoylglutathione lyase family enzyme